jgi:hypothetical protein
MDTDALVTRIRSEFNESPGMCLTLRQGARLWGIAPEECAKVVDRLVAERFLRWTRNGELVRSESGDHDGRASLEAGAWRARGAVGKGRFCRTGTARGDESVERYAGLK